MEKAGMEKGEKHQGAQISPRHVLALSNAGDAKAEDIIALAKISRDKVKAKFGITLEPEVQFVGVEF